MRESQVTMSKKSQNLSFGQNLSLGQNFLAAEFFSFHRYFIENITTDIDMFLGVRGRAAPSPGKLNVKTGPPLVDILMFSIL